jgi:hypothetical protein
MVAAADAGSRAARATARGALAQAAAAARALEAERALE